MFGPITPNRPGLTIVQRVWGKMQAEIIKGRLESAGIPALLDYESVGQVYGITIDGLGEVRVMVPDQYAQDAKLLLAEAADQDSDEALADDQFQDGV